MTQFKIRKKSFVLPLEMILYKNSTGKFNFIRVCKKQSKSSTKVFNTSNQFVDVNHNLIYFPLKILPNSFQTLSFSFEANHIIFNHFPFGKNKILEFGEGSN